MVIKLVNSVFCDEKDTRAKLAEFILTTPQLSMGKECKKFEESFAAKQGRKYAVFVNSGSSANLLLIQALLNTGKLSKGDRVGISALTWATNVMPLIQLGLVPVAIDVELDTLNVSPRLLAPYRGLLQALFLTNALGFCDNIELIKTMCENDGVLFIEDNCESLGSKAYGKLLGNFGYASTFSFYLGHHLSTIEGGMVCTDDKDFYDALLIARAHGWDRQLDEQKKNELRTGDPFYSLYTFYDLGYNLRPTEINGFLGNIQLPYWDHVVSTRHKNFLNFSTDLKLDHMEIISAFAIPCFKDKSKFTDVEIRPIISGNITEQPFYKKYVGEELCPNASYIHKNGFYFTNNPELTDAEIETLQTLCVEP